MNKNKIIVVCIIIIMIVILYKVGVNKEANNINENVLLEGNVYEMMMNTLTRDITNVVETEMTQEELDFYNKYLKEENDEYYNIIEE